MAEDKEKKTSKKWEKYTVEGDSVKAGKSCPKCGPGIFLAEHKDRLACGKCGYMEKKSTNKPANTEDKPEAKQEAKPEPKAEPPKETESKPEEAKEEKPEEKKE
jgi:small subunit ribosomal protein S27Ae